MSNNAMSNETDLDWLARNVHEWPAGADFVRIHTNGNESVFVTKIGASLGGNPFTRDQWLARRAELQNKPSWALAPEWADWLAQDTAGLDGIGAWWWYRTKPTKGDRTWSCKGYSSRPAPTRGEVLCDWRDTLEKRPEEFKPFTSIEDNQDQVLTQQQDNGWFERGELPQVGFVCIFEPGSGSCYFNEYDLKASGKIVKIIAHTRYEHSSCDVAVFRWDLDGCFGVSTGNTQSFRPIRTERDVLIEIIASNLSGTTGKVADAIIAAGFKLEAK